MRDDGRTPRKLDDRLEEARQRSDTLQREADQLLVASRGLRTHSHALLQQLRNALTRRPKPPGQR